MNRHLIQILIVGSALCINARASITVKGIAINCEANNGQLPFVDIYIFDSAKVPRLVSLIQTLEDRKEDPGGTLFPAWFEKVMRVVRETKPLIHTKTDRAGSFRASIPGVDDVVVFGYAKVESSPFYYSYKRVSIANKSLIDVVLDFGNESCRVK